MMAAEIQRPGRWCLLMLLLASSWTVCRGQLEEESGDSCSMTITLDAAQVRKVCQGQAQSPASMVQDIRREFNLVKAENAELKREMEEMREEYQEMIGTVKQLKTETASWREIVEWPLLDEKFRPDNASLIIQEFPTYTDCMDAYNSGQRKQGIYAMEPENAQQPFFAFCDEGGWTVIQRRFDGSTDFYRKWDDYMSGFGELSGEFWLGLENVHLITAQGDYEFKIEALGWNSKLYYAINPNFAVAGEAEEYQLSVGNMTEGNYEDVLVELNGMKFTTLDNDNDEWYTQNCAEYYRGGWWLANCGSDPNRIWCEGSGCATWGERPIKKSLIKIRPMGSNVPDSPSRPNTPKPPKTKPPPKPSKKPRIGKPKKVKKPKAGQTE